MVGSREPEGCIAGHTLVADKDILQGVVKRVTHMKLTGYVRRRDNDGVRLFVRVDSSLEAVVFEPVLIDFILYLFRLVKLS